VASVFDPGGVEVAERWETGYSKMDEQETGSSLVA